jgi:hypothetical protein
MRKYRLVLPESIAKEKARQAEIKKRQKEREKEKQREKRKRAHLREKERIKKLKAKEREKDLEKRRKEKEKAKRHEAALKRQRKREYAWQRKKRRERKLAYFYEHRSEIISEKTKRALLNKKKKLAYDREYVQARKSAGTMERLFLKKKKDAEKKLAEKKVRIHKRNKRYNAKVRRKRYRKEYLAKYYREHKGKENYEKHVLANDIPGKFRIFISRNGVLNDPVCSKSWWGDVLEKWNEMIEENHKDVMCPVVEYTNHHGNVEPLRSVNNEILLLKKIDPTVEDNISVFREENGKTVKVMTSDEEWTVVFKEPWYKEEKFIINSMHPTRGKKTAQWIGENLIEKGLSKDNLKKIFLCNRHVIIDGDEGFDMCIAKTPNTASNLYMALYRKYSETDYVYFVGTLSEMLYKKWVKKIIDKTGWEISRLHLMGFPTTQPKKSGSDDMPKDIPTSSSSTISASND